MNRELASDCSQCVGLCCVALPYAKSADFPVDKDAGTPCHHLKTNFACAIHNSLRENGFKGCVSYECFGAGQYVTQVLFEGKNWRDSSLAIKQEMFATFPIVQQLHEMLAYLNEALKLTETEALHLQLQQAVQELTTLTQQTPQDIRQIDLAQQRIKIKPLFIQSSSLYRRSYPSQKKTKKRTDYLGANLKGRNLQGRDFRSALLIAADLREADLRGADLIGADLRDAQLNDADLSEALFLTQPQINAAIGNERTRLPDHLVAPAHWKTRC